MPACSVQYSLVVLFVYFQGSILDETAVHADSEEGVIENNSEQKKSFQKSWFDMLNFHMSLHFASTILHSTFSGSEVYEYNI